MLPQLNFGAKSRPRTGLTPLWCGSATSVPAAESSLGHGAVSPARLGQGQRSELPGQEGFARACAELPLPQPRAQAEPTWKNSRVCECLAAQEELGQRCTKDEGTGRRQHRHWWRACT